VHHLVHPRFGTCPRTPRPRSSRSMTVTPLTEDHIPVTPQVTHRRLARSTWAYLRRPRVLTRQEDFHPIGRLKRLEMVSRFEQLCQRWSRVVADLAQTLRQGVAWNVSGEHTVSTRPSRRGLPSSSRIRSRDAVDTVIEPATSAAATKLGAIGVCSRRTSGGDVLPQSFADVATDPAELGDELFDGTSRILRTH